MVVGDSTRSVLKFSCDSLMERFWKNMNSVGRDSFRHIGLPASNRDQSRVMEFASPGGSRWSCRKEKIRSSCHLTKKVKHLCLAESNNFYLYTSSVSSLDTTIIYAIFFNSLSILKIIISEYLFCWSKNLIFDIFSNKY